MALCPAPIRVLLRGPALYFMEFMLTCAIPMTHNTEGSIKTSSLSEKQCRRLLAEDRLRLLLRRAGAVKGAKKARKSAEKVAKQLEKREAKKQRKELKKKKSSSTSLGSRQLPSIPGVGGGSGVSGDVDDDGSGEETESGRSSFQEALDIRNDLLYGEIGDTATVADVDVGAGASAAAAATPERTSNLRRSWSSKKKGKRATASVVEIDNEDDDEEEDGGGGGSGDVLYATVDKTRAGKTPTLPPRASAPQLNLNSATGDADATDATNADGSLIYEMVGQAADPSSPLQQQPPAPQDLYATIEQTAAEMAALNEKQHGMIIRTASSSKVGTWKVVSALEDVSTDAVGDADDGGGGGEDTGTMVTNDTIMSGGNSGGLFGIGSGGMMGTLSKASAGGLRAELLAVEAELERKEAAAEDEYITAQQSEYAEYAELVLDEPISLRWYAGDLSRRECEDAVMADGQVQGDFLVRESNQADRFVLCVNDIDRACNFPIDITMDRTFVIGSRTY